MAITTETTFTLRLPSEYKAAAKALAKTNFDEPLPDRGDGYFRFVSFFSTSDAVTYLMRHGMVQTLERLEAQIGATKAEIDVWEPISAFFLQNAAANYAIPANFDELSPARAYLVQLEEQSEAARLEMAGICAFDEHVGVSRAEAQIELTRAQRLLANLVTAKGAMQKALGRKR